MYKQGTANVWRLIDTGASGAEFNMALDEAIASLVLQGEMPPTLRFFSWERPSVTIGHFQRFSDVNIAFCEKNAIPVVRRPTGGRAILHSDEITYSFSARNTDNREFKNLLNSYKTIAGAFSLAFKSLGMDVSIRHGREKGKRLVRNPHCFKSVSFGEITIKGNKILGSAQKRYREGFLQQGSMPFSIDQRAYDEIFAKSDGITGLADIYPSIGESELKSAIRDAFEKTFGITLRRDGLTEEEIKLAHKVLNDKYRPLEPAGPRDQSRNGNNTKILPLL